LLFPDVQIVTSPAPTGIEGCLQVGR